MLQRRRVVRGRSTPARFAAVSVGVGALIAVLCAPLAAAVDAVAENGSAAIEESLPADSLLAPMPQRSTVLAADGSVLATFFRQDRVEVPLEEIAPVLRDALIATEDARFYSHGGVDPQGMARAVVANLVAGGVAEGASTLTQQYVKQALVLTAQTEAEQKEATETSLDRKLRELGYALGLERRLTKDEILARYLNIAYFGHGAYGAEVAAQRYFNVSAADLTLPQAALLAGLVKAPTVFDPVRNPDAALARRSAVLDRMADTGVITTYAARAAKGAPLDLDLQPARNGCAQAEHAFFCGYVVSEIAKMTSLGDTPQERQNALLTGGLTVRTTLDPKTQDAAVRAIRRHIGDDHRVGTAIVMTEPGTGAVRAIAQNRRYGEGRKETTVNYALDRDQGGSAGFQGGSTFKPFVLAAALDEGLDPSLRLPAPSRTTVSGFENCRTDAKFPSWSVGNYENRGYYRLDMGAATAMSVNTYFARLESLTGICAPTRLAEDMGLRRADGGDLTRVPSFVLGVDEVSPLRMAEAYATIAAGGIHCDSHAITAIDAAEGEEYEVPAADCERALPRKVATGVKKLLQGVIDGPYSGRTGRAMSLGRPAGGKTGTTNDATAVWFAGFSGDLAAAVWAGYPEASKPLRNITLQGRTYDQLYGGALPGPIWRAAMRAALRR